MRSALLLLAFAGAASAQSECRLATGLNPSVRAGAFSVCGLVQARYAYQTGAAVQDLSVARGHLMAAYELPSLRFALQIDASSQGVRLLDAKAIWIAPWSDAQLEVTAGQMKWPFGAELAQPSAERILPERSTAIRAFAPEARDRGLQAQLRWRFLELAAGVFNGNGISAPTDNDSSKDLIGRAGVKLRWIAFGVSGWWGESKDPVAVRFKPRRRIGADFSANAGLAPFGRTELQLEAIAGETYVRGTQEIFDEPAYGAAATITQRIGQSDRAVLRADWFDPALSIPDAVRNGLPAETNATLTFGLAVAHDFSPHLRATAALELPLTFAPPGVADPADNRLTLQVQARF